MRRDMAWVLRANGWARQSSLTPGIVVVSRLGDGPLWYALMVAVALVDGLHGLIASVHMALTGLLALGLYMQLKRHTQRPRPYATEPRVTALTPALDEFSFPSGHTLHAVSFTIVALAWYPQLAWLLVPFTLAIAASRVVLGLHYPSDVLAAAVIGSALSTLSLLPLLWW
ncbi:phosphatase PAP2 family protein [Pseudoxanthomonas sp. CAU 1598]|uniref:undecaprenyl-diphosphate phosphatase n=2 Tax=Pseudomarimonas arenosa TaxID=2774145 RepID=A0AAW3ZJX5_9GAMM|nr:phosphatase PAP2 family protein [Pseudomarimonas arenosa]